MRRSIAAAVAAGTLLFVTGCGGGGSSAPTTTVERDRKVRDDDITQETADVALRCTALVADLMNFDVSWITSSTPPATIAPVDPELLDEAREECGATLGALEKDLDPVAGIGQTMMLIEQTQFILDELNAPQVNLAPDTGLAMAMLNVQGTITGEFRTRPPLVIN